MYVKMRSLVVCVVLCCVRADTDIIFHLEEESPVGKLVGNIAEASGLKETLSPENLRSVRFNLLQSTEIISALKLNTNTGDLYAIRRIDREEMCGINEVCSMTLKVACYSSAIDKFDVVNIAIIIDDINDNSPRFPTENVSLEISESTVTGTIFSLDIAFDNDIGENGMISYHLSQVGSPFELQIGNQSNKETAIHLLLKSNLDREQMDSYTLHVVAEDGGTVSHTGNCIVEIKILDENDNDPVFDKSVHNVSIRENSEIGTLIIKLNASDLDQGQNGEVTFRFSQRQPNLDQVNELFHINESDGQVTVGNNLVSASGKSLGVVIEARDKGQRPRSTFTTVNIQIQDVSNNEPEMNINFLSLVRDNAVTISESSNIGTVIAYLTVDDNDSGDNGKVSCDIVSDILKLKYLGEKSYIIVTVKSLDRENLAKYDVSVTCADGGNPSLAVSTRFNVGVSDENDNAPEFSRPIYYASMPENNPIGKIVTKVTAMDKDIDRNSEFQYYLEENAQACFSIAPRTGIIKATCSIDREAVNQHNITVLARDFGTPAMTGSALVVLSISDKNDNAPEFSVQTFQFFALENIPSGIKVGSLSATDIDEGINQNILFSIGEESRSSTPFTVFQNGDIQTNRELDREAKDSYRFKVVAFDLGTPSMTSTADVIIRVADDNDNSPVITFPVDITESVSVPYLSPIGTFVTRIRAYDLDEEGPNSQLKFSFAQGNEEGLFSIDENLGIVQLKKNKLIKKDETFKMTVVVNDSGYISNTAKKVVYITLRYYNESREVTEDFGSRNAMITTSVATVTIMIAVIIATVICIIKRNSHKNKMFGHPDEEAAGGKAMMKPEPEIVQVKQVMSTGITTECPSKPYASTTEDEDMDNMELFNSTGTSMFTNTLIESQKFITSAEENSDDSDDDLPNRNNRSKGGSYLDIYKLNRMKTLGYFGPKPKFEMHPVSVQSKNPMDVI